MKEQKKEHKDNCQEEMFETSKALQFSLEEGSVFEPPWIQESHWRNRGRNSEIKPSLLFPFSTASCPLRFYQYSGDRASHYAAPTTLALSLLVTDRPAIVPATVQRALTLNSLAGRLPVPASSRNTRRLGSHEGDLESTCHRQWQTTRSPWNPPPEPLLHALRALHQKESKEFRHTYVIWREIWM